MSSEINICIINAIVAIYSDYGAMKKTLKLNRFLAKVWASGHRKFISPPYSRM